MSGTNNRVEDGANESTLEPRVEGELDGIQAINLASGVASAANNALSNIGTVAEVAEKDPDTLAVETLENLREDLAVAIAEFGIITGTEYLVIEEGIMAVEGGGLDMVFPFATPDDIDIFVLFPVVHEYNKEGQIAFFKGLLERIKILSPQIQAYILWLNELIKTKCSKVFSDSFKEQQKQYEKALEGVINPDLSENNLKLLVEKLLANNSSIEEFVKKAPEDLDLRPGFDVKNPVTERHYTNLNLEGVEIGRIAIGDRWYPKFGDKIIKEIDGVEIKSCYYVHSNPITGEISGEITSIDDKKYLFVGDRLIRTIGGKEAIRFINIHTQPNGTLAGGMVIKEGLIKNYLSDGKTKTYLFVGDTLIDTIGENIIEHIIQDCYCIHTQPNGTLAGMVRIGGKRIPFIGNKIIYTIGGQDVEDCDNIHTLPNGLLAGDVWLQGKKLSFIGDEIV